MAAAVVASPAAAVASRAAADDQHPDAQGRITLPALIPGATYRIAWFDGTDRPFKVESGKTMKLGDLTIKEPEKTKELPITKQ